jgi:tetratricopeptide (TPR) repeat protein
MKLNSLMQLILSQLNVALVKQDEALLQKILEGCDLPELLSQSTLMQARARDKNRLVVFLSTLAVHNDIETQRAQQWLDCYMSIGQKKLQGQINALSPHHILRMAVEARMTQKVIRLPAKKKAGGSVQAWKDAFELLIDGRDWNSALTLLEIMGSDTSRAGQWVEISKSLSARHHLYVDQTGLAKVDIDYEKLAQIYRSCAQAAKQAKMIDLLKALHHLQASALETAGHYEEAIAILNSMHRSAGSAPLIDMARCQCKMGDMHAAIATLDQLLCTLEEHTHIQLNQIDNEVEKKEEQSKPKQFNIQAASLALRDLAEVMNSRGLKYFLVSGTLLGYVREGQLLSHDKDIDVGLIGWENQYDMCMALQETGLFTVGSEFLRGHKSYYIPIRHNSTGMWIDVFIYHMIGEKMVTGVDFFFGYRQTFAFTPFALKEIEFMGVKMYAPENAELNLEENFGNWRVPDSSYISHLESPSTVDKGGLPFMLTARLSAIAAMVQGKEAKLGKVLELMRAHQSRPASMSQELIDSLEKRCHEMSHPREMAHAA